ncbi:MAG: glycosyltransferase family 39 protein, partial [Acetobacteraceae bacterium]
MSGESSASRRGLDADRHAATGFVHVRLHDRAAAPAISAWIIAACFLGFVTIWTLYGTIADTGMALPGDVVEAYSWGREFQLGYNQHPPFWAWAAGLWFLVFPNQSWAFRLLAVINSAIGLLGCWHLIGLFARGWERLAAWVLLLLTPFYTFLCYKYNANSIFLSIWPWTLYFLLTSIETRKPSHAVWLGIMLAAGLLSKYYAITLDLTCLAASLIHPAARAYYRSICPYLSAAVCAVLIAPHVLWLLDDNAPPVMYIWGHTGIGMGAALVFALRFVASVALFHVLVLLIVLTAMLPAGRPRLDLRMLVRNRVLTVLVMTPVILTVLFGLLFELKISSNMTIGVFPLLPLLAMRLVPGVQPDASFRRAAWVLGCIIVVVLLASPAVAYVTFATSNEPE